MKPSNLVGALAISTTVAGGVACVDQHQIPVHEESNIQCLTLESELAIKEPPMIVQGERIELNNRSGL